MWQRRTLTLALAGALAAGCQTVPPDADTPARILDPGPASRADLQSAVDEAMQQSVALAATALTDSDILIIERQRPRSAEGRLATGRNMDLPVQFRLVINGSDCVLIDTRDDSRSPLRNTRCIAL
jgi:hypothetical protein